jgi:hypothetical protein
MFPLFAQLQDPQPPTHVAFEHPLRRGVASWGASHPSVAFEFDANHAIVSVTVYDASLPLRIIAGHDAILSEPWLTGLAKSLEEHLSGSMY